MQYDVVRRRDPGLAARRSSSLKTSGPRSGTRRGSSARSRPRRSRYRPPVREPSTRSSTRSASTVHGSRGFLGPSSAIAVPWGAHRLRGTFGGTGHKRAEGQVRLAHLLAERHGVAATAIDMPGAGDRPEVAAEAKRREWMTIEDALADLWTEMIITETIADWKGAIAHLQVSPARRRAHSATGGCPAARCSGPARGERASDHGGRARPERRGADDDAARAERAVPSALHPQSRRRVRPLPRPASPSSPPSAAPTSGFTRSGGHGNIPLDEIEYCALFLAQALRIP